MELSRRDFLKLSGGAAGGAALLATIPTGAVLAAPKPITLKKRIGEVTTICCFCGVGCGAVVAAEPDKVITIEGDPDHPINQGTLCSKGQALMQMRTIDGKDNPRRVTKPLYRAANSTQWEEKSWDWMINTIADRIKDTRDNNWSDTLNHTDAISNFGGGELDTEECYLLSKMCRALGVVYLEHCARI